MVNVNYKLEGNMYELTITEFGKVLYRDKFNYWKKAAYEKLIDARLEVLLQDCGKLHTPYVMFELGGMMWRCDDVEWNDYRSLTRCASPLFYTTEESRTVDLLFDSTLYDFFPYEKDSLVYKFDRFWMNGECLGTLEDLKDKVEIKKSNLTYLYGNEVKEIKEYFEDLKDVTITSFITDNSQSYY